MGPCGIKRLTGLLCILAFCLSGALAQADSGTRQQLQDMLDAQWGAYSQDRADWKGGMALYMLTPQGDYFASSGFDQTVDQNVHFRSASTTKTFTAAAVMLLADRGLINIDDRITDIMPGQTQPYLPNTPAYEIPFKSRITIRELLGHRAGVFDLDNDPLPSGELAGKHYMIHMMEQLGDDQHTFTTAEMAAALAKYQPYYFEPGHGYHYSDTGYNLLSQIVERASGQVFGDFVTANLLRTNHLMDSSLPYLGWDQDLPANYASGYSLVNGTAVDVTRDNMSLHVGEGNLITTPANLARWAQRLIEGQSGLSAYALAQMKALQPADSSGGLYGLGLTYSQGLGYGHNGATQGYWTLMRHDPQNHVTTLVFDTVFDHVKTMKEQNDILYTVARSARQIIDAIPPISVPPAH